MTPITPKILYVYDALCGWCFGFSPVMARLSDEYKDKLTFEVISGGLMVGERVGPIGVVAPYIKNAYQDVERATGVLFGEKFVKGSLEKGTMVLNSIPPAIAMCIFRECFPEKSLAFAGLLHNMIYIEGVEPENIEVYSEYASNMGFDKVEFNTKMSDPSYLRLAQSDFERAQALRADGFPAVYFQKDNKLEKIVSGYVPYERLRIIVHEKMATEWN
jgi:putative protein-disulfide isomerase